MDFSHVVHLPYSWTDSTTWALVALALFVALMLYLGVPGFLARKLDQRADAIRSELDEAKRLREEAQELLARYQRRQREAEAEAAEIVEQARRAAGHMAEAARAEMRDQLDRRAALAERRIEQAEANALALVRAEASETAAAAAERLLRDKLGADAQARLFSDSVAELSRRLG